MKRLEQINLIIDQAINEASTSSSKSNLEKARPKRSFIEQLRKKDISEEEYLEIFKTINSIIYKEIIQKYPFSSTEDNKINSKLSHTLKNFYNFHYSIHFGQNKAKIYPVSLDQKTIKTLYKNELLAIIQEHLTTNEDYDSLINKRISIYEERINFYKLALKKLEIIPYYGTPEFMYERAAYIIECSKRLPFKTENLDSLLSEMRAFKDQYPATSEKHYPYYNRIYKMEYDKFEQNYLKVLEFENSLMPQMSEIWQKYLTDPKNHNNSSFKYIISTFTKNIVPPNIIDKAYCTLATEHLLTIPYGTCGLIYDFNFESVEIICAEDSDHQIVNKEDFINKDLPLNWQFTSEQTFYEYPKLSKLILPTDLEKAGIANNLVSNHELLNYTNSQAHPKILLNSEATPIGIFYTDTYQNIEELKAYAKKYGLPLIHLSLSELRTQAKLNPIATNIEPNKEVNNHRSY